MLAGIDIGTSGTKALLLNESGAVRTSTTIEYPLSSPHPGWSEQNPEDWWQAAKHALDALVAETGSLPNAVGLTGQMHGAVFLDSRGEVLRPAILWNDQRTARECREIDEVVGAARVRDITRNPPLTGFQLPKLLWLRRNEPKTFDRVRKVLLPKDYVRFRLTGKYLADVSDASGTGAFDVTRRAWSRDILKALDIDPSLFPEVAESSEAISITINNKKMAVAAGGGDQAAAGVGTGAVREGIVSVSLGTSGVVFTALDKLPPEPTEQAHTFCHANGSWHAMTVMLSCGGAVRWLRDTLYPGWEYDAITAEASTVPAGCDGLTFLPYLTGERSPHNDPGATASFSGLTARHARAHMARAVFEGVTYGLLDGLDVLRGMNVNATQLRVNSGGAKSKFWLQLLADVTGVPCVTLECDEGPAYGAAILGGVSIGCWANVEEACDSVVRTRECIEPNSSLSQVYSESVNRYRSLYHNLRTWGRT